MNTDWKSPRQVSAETGLGINLVLFHINKGNLKASNVSSGVKPRWRIHANDIRDWMDRLSNQFEEPRRRPRKPSLVRKYV